MSFDKSRFTFNPLKDYSGVVMQQGRVQLDSDWNEWLAELSRRIQAGTLDILGQAVYPATTPYAFLITASSAGGSNVLTIGPGRMYVDGLLAENHGVSTAAQWDPALAEMSNTPQPPPSTETGAIDYTKQPYMPANSKLPAGNGPFLAFLDVWTRPVTYLIDPNLIDKAVGIDTTGRLQTAWQVKLLDLSNLQGATCSSSIPGWPPPASAGLLTTGTAPMPPSGPCCLTAGTAYTGMENQFYRVEIHQPGVAESSAVPPTSLAPGTATFVFSRDDASVITGVTGITTVTNSIGNPASQLAVMSLGRDQVLGFAPGNWIEILDDDVEFSGQPGELHQIDTIDFSARTITLVSTLSGFTAGAHTRIRRWDQSGKVYEQDGTTVWWDVDANGGDIPVPPPGVSLLLESGITVTFSVSSSGGSFLTGDFWTFAARTADGSVEILSAVPPRGIHHHYARLAIVNFPNSAQDCRTEWPPTTSTEECGCCCKVTVGDGVESFGKFSSINAAIGALPASGGEVCILPGRYYEHVVINGRRDIVLRGCGWQTRIASPSLQPPTVFVAPAGAPPAAGTSPAPAAPAAPSSSSSSSSSSSITFAAVITVSSSQHVQLLSFAVEAAQDEVGILLDGSGKLAVGQSPFTATTVAAKASFQSAGVVDVTIEDLVLTASTRSAILAHQVELLEIEKNRIAMANVASMWPAVWVGGTEMRIAHNWVGLQAMIASATKGAPPDSEWLPVTVTGDLSADANAAGGGNTIGVKNPIQSGGILIAGESNDVFVEENEIEQAGRNGITLGSLSILDSSGNDTGQVSGTTIVEQGPCDTTVTLQVPGTETGVQGGTVVASGKLLNIQINRNRISNCGLCGIGPVGFFDLSQVLEVISIENLTISANVITSTVLRPLAASNAGVPSFGYAAICVPDVEGLVIRDNSITDFGQQPGAEACGIFILNGQSVEISRNNILETRDWDLASSTTVPANTGITGGIVVYFATPRTLTTTASFSGESSPPVYEAGLPALRIEHNVVRVPLGEALEAFGTGPFSIVNNHLGCGGAVQESGQAIAEAVLIVNIGTALEVATAAGKFSAFNQSGFANATPALSSGFAGSTGGAVIFTNNICEFEARMSGLRSLSSVAIFSLDDLIFSSNQCWLDGPVRTAIVDAFLFAGSLQVTGNRFQESLGSPVFLSGVTLGSLNITVQNISTYCLVAEGFMQPAISTNNLVAAFPQKNCDALAGELAQALQL